MLALFLAASGQSEAVDTSLQNHLLNVIDANGTINVTGHAWGQLGSIERVEYRIDGGDWDETTYSAEPGEIGALTPFMWHVIMNPEKLSEGAHEIEVRAVSGEGNSLPVLVTVHGSGSEGNGFSVPPIVIVGIASVFAIWVASLALLRFRSDGEIDSLLSNLRRKEEGSAIEEVLDAEIVDEEAID